MILVDEYLSAIKHFEEASISGDQKTAKKFYKVMDANFRKLRDSGRLGELIKFIDHENARVRLWVSTHLLVFNEKVARNSLEKLVKEESDLVGFDAEMTLQEWDKGNLTYLIE